MAKRRGKPARSGSVGGRLPFDPSRMAFRAEGAPPAPPIAPARTEDPGRLTVSQLSALVSSALRSGLPARVRVLGEVSGVSERTHFYFKLKDEGAVVDCVLFASQGGRARRVEHAPKDGAQVVATGRIDHYARQGRTQLYVESLEPIGAGALEARLRALCDELRALGWFDEARKRALPVFPRRVAVVTSLNGAAMHDVLDTMRRRCAAVEALLVDVRVQSDPPLLAAREVARAIGWISANHARLGVDTLIVTRGGGSIEDLWAFNERGLAEAILACAIPVIAAIGHESDVTIAELVADVRAATPTQAAMRATPDTAALLEQLDQHQGRVRMALARRLAEARQRLSAAARHAVFARPMELLERPAALVEERRSCLERAARDRLRDAAWKVERLASRLALLRPETVIAERTARVGELERRLVRASTVALARRIDRVGGLERALGAVGPQSVLRRGFSVTLRENGAVARSATDVTPGERLTTRLADGSVRSIVEGGEGRAAMPLGKRPTRGGEGGEGLFA